MRSRLPTYSSTRGLRNWISGFGIIGVLAFVCCFLAFVGTIIYATFLGLYMAFSASILLGILVLVVEPAPLVIGLWYLMFGVDLAERFLIAFS